MNQDIKLTKREQLILSAARIFVGISILAIIIKILFI